MEVSPGDRLGEMAAGVGVADGDRQNMEPLVTTLFDGPSTTNVRVPKIPLVLILKDFPALIWKVFCAIRDSIQADAPGKGREYSLPYW